METEITYRTDFLTTKSSFISGMGTVLNLGGNYYDFNRSQDAQTADRRAIENDWKMIGQDFKRTFKSIFNW